MSDRSREQLERELDSLQQGVKEMLDTNMQLREALEIALEMTEEGQDGEGLGGGQVEKLRTHLKTTLDNL